MTRFVLRRIGQAIIVLLVMSFVIYGADRADARAIRSTR